MALGSFDIEALLLSQNRTTYCRDKVFVKLYHFLTSLITHTGIKIILERSVQSDLDLECPIVKKVFFINLLTFMPLTFVNEMSYLTSKIEIDDRSLGSITNQFCVLYIAGLSHCFGLLKTFFQNSNVKYLVIWLALGHAQLQQASEIFGNSYEHLM